MLYIDRIPQNEREHHCSRWLVCYRHPSRREWIFGAICANETMALAVAKTWPCHSSIIVLVLEWGCE